MLSRSDLNLARADVAEIAQMLRGGGAFGSVVFCENAGVAGDCLEVNPGYSDCLPVRGGCFWCDPVLPAHVETIE